MPRRPGRILRGCPGCTHEEVNHQAGAPARETGRRPFWAGWGRSGGAIDRAMSGRPQIGRSRNPGVSRGVYGHVDARCPKGGSTVMRDRWPVLLLATAVAVASCLSVAGTPTTDTARAAPEQLTCTWQNIGSNTKELFHTAAAFDTAEQQDVHLRRAGADYSVQNSVEVGDLSQAQLRAQWRTVSAGTARALVASGAYRAKGVDSDLSAGSFRRRIANPQTGKGDNEVQRYLVKAGRWERVAAQRHRLRGSRVRLGCLRSDPRRHLGRRRCRHVRAADGDDRRPVQRTAHRHPVPELGRHHRRGQVEHPGQRQPELLRRVMVYDALGARAC